MKIAYVLWAFTILFTGLKLTGHITWSWWLVFLPVYGPFVVGFALGIILGFLKMIIDMLDASGR
jgi:hypothetical protein